jgi:hypothetical protein
LTPTPPPTDQRIRVVATFAVDPDRFRRLAALLKALGRWHGVPCLDVREEK